MIQGEIVLDYSQFSAKLRTLDKRLIPMMKTTAREIAGKVHEEIRLGTPPVRRTGGTQIRDLWKMQHQSRNASIEEYIISNTYQNQDVVGYFEEGTDPHTISPKRVGGFLHFFLDAREGGTEIYTRKPVHHPGTVAWHMVAQGEKLGEHLIDKYLSQTLAMVARLSDTGKV